MKTRSISLCMTIAALSTAALAAETVSKPSSGRGKVRIFTDDATALVTNAVFHLEGGECDFTGLGLSFADGADVTISTNKDGGASSGTLLLGGGSTFAGSVNFKRTDGAYVEWTDATPLSATATTVKSGGVASADDWEAVMLYARSSTWAESTNTTYYHRGPYLPLTLDVEDNTYCMNRWRGMHGYTYSARLKLTKSGSDLQATILSAGRSKLNVCLPYTDLYSVQETNPDAWDTTFTPNYTTLDFDRLIVRRKNSGVTVGIAANTTFTAAAVVDVGLGLKLAVMPSGSATFAAPMFKGRGDVEYRCNATLANANYMEQASSLSITNGALVTVSGVDSFPTNAMVNVYQDSVLRISRGTADRNLGISGGYAFLNAFRGGMIQVATSKGGIENGVQEIFVDGGTYWPGYDLEYSSSGKWGDVWAYAPFLTLMNGGRVRGRYALWGNNRYMRWNVGGERGSPCTIDAIGAIAFYSASGSASSPSTDVNVFKISVDDITGSNDADCIVAGEVPAFCSDQSTVYHYYTTQKYGEGTLRFNGKWSLRGTTTVNAGGIVFGDAGGAYTAVAKPSAKGAYDRNSFIGYRNFVLKNGAMLGKTAGALELDTLTVTGGGVLELGPEATMTFADSSGCTWTGTLGIKGFHDKAVRFGTASGGITAEQCSQIRLLADDGTEYNPGLTIDSEGYLRYFSSGDFANSEVLVAIGGEGASKTRLFFDASSKITNAVFHLDGGVCALALPGLAFADGATLEVSTNSAGDVSRGEVRLGDGFTYEGGLNLRRTDGSYHVCTTTLNEGYQVVRDDDMTGQTSVGDWEISKAYVRASELSGDFNSVCGAYVPLNPNPVVEEASRTHYRFFLMNGYRGKFGYTWSLRCQLGYYKDTSETGKYPGKLYARLNTAVHSPQNVYMPADNLWVLWQESFPEGSGIYAPYEYNPSLTNVTSGAIWGGSPENVHLDRLVVCRTNSCVTVGFAGAKFPQGAQVDVDLGLKFAVLPKENDVFVAPVFKGEGDVEYRSDAILSNANYMVYAPGLDITNGATVVVGGYTHLNADGKKANIAFPTNAHVNVYDGTLRLAADVADNSAGISGGLAFLNVYSNGELQVSGSKIGQIANGRQEIFVDGGTYWVDWPNEFDGTEISGNYYSPYLTFRNGARAKGSYLRWGNNQPQRWTVGGASDSPADPVVLGGVIDFAYKTQSFNVVVHDITGDSGADMIVSNRVIRRGRSVSDWESLFGKKIDTDWLANVHKYGEGTLRFEDNVVLRGRMTVHGGAVVFGDRAETYPDCTGEADYDEKFTNYTYRTSLGRDVTLAAGTTLGKTAGTVEFGTLTMTNATLDVGAGSIRFADSSETAWEGTLAIANFHERGVCFGTDENGLTAAQFAMIEACDEDGNDVTGRLRMGEDGFLTLEPVTSFANQTKEMNFGNFTATVKFDGAEKVTNAVFYIDGNEGEFGLDRALTFAAGADVVVSTNSVGGPSSGTVYFLPNVSFEGAVNFKRTDDAYVEWTGGNLSATATTVKSGGVASADDWEIVMVYAEAEALTDENHRGPYLPLTRDVEDGTYCLNRWCPKEGHTYSVRIRLSESGGDLKAAILSLCKSPHCVCRPYTDIASVGEGTDITSDAAGKHFNRLIARRRNSEVTVGIPGSVSVPGPADIPLGVKFAVLEAGGATFTAPVFKGRGDVEYRCSATLAQANMLKYSPAMDIMDGATVTVTANSALPTNGVVNVNDGGVLLLRTSANSLSGGYPELFVRRGGELRVAKDSAQHTFENGKQRVFADGGTVWVGYDKTSGTEWKEPRAYLPFLTLMNGAEIKGPYANRGNGQPSRWTIAGENGEPVAISAIGSLGYKGQVLTNVVDDITGDARADCIVSGEMPASLAGDKDFRYYTMQKLGDGTLRIEDKWALRGTTTIRDGGIVFGDNGEAFPLGAEDAVRSSVAGCRDFVLADGTTLGKTSGKLELDTLTMTNATLEIGSGARISFADSSACPWSGTLTLNGFRDGSVRFGKTSGGLTGYQLECLVDPEDPRPIYILNNGFLVHNRGMLVLFR